MGQETIKSLHDCSSLSEKLIKHISGNHEEKLIVDNFQGNEN